MVVGVCLCAYPHTERSALAGIMFVEIVLQGVPSSAHSHHNMIPQNLHTHTFMSKCHLQLVWAIYLLLSFPQNKNSDTVKKKLLTMMDQHIFLLVYAGTIVALKTIIWQKEVLYTVPAQIWACWSLQPCICPLITSPWGTEMGKCIGLSEAAPAHTHKLRNVIGMTHTPLTDYSKQM